MFDTLLLSGGASRGYYQLGCIQANIDKLKSTTRYVGTSVGSIIALLIICGLTTAEIMDMSLQVKVSYPEGSRWRDWFNKIKLPFMGSLAPWLDMIGGLVTRNGMMQENPYIVLASKTIKKKMGRIPTMKELYDMTGKELICSVTCISTYETVYVTHTSHPDMSVITAIDMSSRVPILFTPIKYDGLLYVDGGITDHFSLSKTRGKTLGIFTHDVPLGQDGEVNIATYMWSLYNSATKNRYLDRPRGDDIVMYSFSSLGGGMSATREEAMAMYLAGYIASPDEDGHSNGQNDGKDPNHHLASGNEDHQDNGQDEANDKRSSNAEN